MRRLAVTAVAAFAYVMAAGGVNAAPTCNPPMDASGVMTLPRALAGRIVGIITYEDTEADRYADIVVLDSTTGCRVKAGVFADEAKRCRIGQNFAYSAALQWIKENDEPDYQFGLDLTQDDTHRCW